MSEEIQSKGTAFGDSNESKILVKFWFSNSDLINPKVLCS